MGDDTSQTRINHSGDAFNSDRAFGHIGGTDDFSRSAGSYGCVLFRRTEFTVQRKHGCALLARDWLTGRDGFANFSGAGKKDQDVTTALSDELRDCGSDLRF